MRLWSFFHLQDHIIMHSQRISNELAIDMKNLITTLGIVALGTLGANAATITSAGTLTDLTSAGFGSGTEVADLDATGAAADGFVIFNSVPEGTNVANRPWDEALVNNSPAYISTMDGSGSASSGGWANYDDVMVGGTQYNTGGLVISPGNGLEVPLLTFELGASVPPAITLGVITNHSDSPNWSTTNIRIEGPGGITDNQSVNINGGTDLVQFDINGGVAGETYTVYATSPGSGALIGGLTFASVPEPSSLGLLFVGAGFILRRRVR